MALLLYGAGRRLLECARLRVHDVAFGATQNGMRRGKADRDRVTLLPDGARNALTRRLAGVRDARITKPGSCPTFRHSCTTYVLNRGPAEVRSPLDRMVDR